MKEIKINPKVKSILGGAVLLVSAIGAFVDVFEKDRKDKAFETMKKDVEALKSKMGES